MQANKLVRHIVIPRDYVVWWLAFTWCTTSIKFDTQTNIRSLNSNILQFMQHVKFLRLIQHYNLGNKLRTILIGYISHLSCFFTNNVGLKMLSSLQTLCLLPLDTNVFHTYVIHQSQVQ